MQRKKYRLWFKVCVYVYCQFCNSYLGQQCSFLQYLAFLLRLFFLAPWIAPKDSIFPFCSLAYSLNFSTSFLAAALWNEENWKLFRVIKIVRYSYHNETLSGSLQIKGVFNGQILRRFAQQNKGTFPPFMFVPRYIGGLPAVKFSSTIIAANQIRLTFAPNMIKTSLSHLENE